MSSSRIRVLLVSMLAVFAVSAVASAAASAAAPEFLHCVAKTGGKFEAGCKTAGTKFEKEAVKAGVGKLKFTDKSGVSVLWGEDKIKITCQKDKTKGEITGAKTVANLETTFEECKAKKGTEECVPNGGTITTAVLHGELGTVAKGEAATEVGEALIPPSETKEGKEVKLPFVELTGTCLPKASKVEGTVIGEVKPVKELTEKGEVIFKCFSTEPPVQEIEKIGGVKDTLSVFGSEACFESKDEITFEEPIEVT